MTTRERWQAAVSGGETDRLLFWPKLDRSYLHWYGSKHGYSEIGQFHNYIGSEPLGGVPSCTTDLHGMCSVSSWEDGDRHYREITTPVGAVRSMNQFDHGSQSFHPVEFPIKSRADILSMRTYYDDMTPVVSEEGIEAAQILYKRAPDTFFAWEAIGTTALMWFVQHLAGIENGHFLLNDYPAEVEGLFEAMQQYLVRKTRIMTENSCADMLVLVENTSTSLITPDQYRRYCYPHIKAMADLCNESGTILALHMCGFLRDLLPDLNTVGARVFEAFTSPPVGNTAFPVGREALPEICLIGGTNAALWIRPADEIIAAIKADLDQLPHHRGIVVSSAGVMPPLCQPDTVRRVSDWIHSYSIR